MSVNPFSVVDYLPPIGMETYTIVIKVVDNEEISWLTFRMPLRFETWLFMLGLALLFTFTIHLSAKLMEKPTGPEVKLTGDLTNIFQRDRPTVFAFECSL